MINTKDIKTGMQVHCKDGNLVATVDAVEADGKSIKCKRDAGGAVQWFYADAIASLDAKGLHLKTNAVDAKKAMHNKAPHSAPAM